MTLKVEIRSISMSLPTRTVSRASGCAIGGTLETLFVWYPRHVGRRTYHHCTQICTKGTSSLSAYMAAGGGLADIVNGVCGLKDGRNGRTTRGFRMHDSVKREIPGTATSIYLYQPYRVQCAFS